jgi:hypothetical protein
VSSGGAGYSVVVELDRGPVTGKRRQKWHSGYRPVARDAATLVAGLFAGVSKPFAAAGGEDRD